MLRFLETVDSATLGKSILPERTLSLDVWDDRPQRPSPLKREVILHLKEPSLTGQVRTLAVDYGEDTIKGIFPKRPEKM